jgi:hypothetical protein
VPQFKIELTKEQDEALVRYAARQGIKSKRAALHKLIGEFLSEDAGDVTLALPPKGGWGGWRGNEASLKALMAYADRVSNGGRDDPAESDE